MGLFYFIFVLSIGQNRKVYCVDNGLLNSISFKFSDDFGKLMENQIFLELYRRRNKIFYNRDKFECDFVIREKIKLFMRFRFVTI
ncbi:ATP-binding protein [Candidatus Pacearchaeota archaeon]|nr:ATP-binding protein [Candidatus Pacearchaeota archaeon]